jgi:hypothetical protein
VVCSQNTPSALWQTIKQEVVRSIPQTIEEPKENIRKENVSVLQELQNMDVNFLWRCKE